MSEYHVLGITHEGKLQSLTSRDSRDEALVIASAFVSDYRQLFLLESGVNVRELKFIPPIKGGWEEGEYSPLVLER